MGGTRRERLGWNAVLPYFASSSATSISTDRCTGMTGLCPRRIFQEHWAEHAKAVAAGFEAMGFRYLPDQNGPFEDGYHPLAISNLYDRRVSVAFAYLPPTVRMRENLTIMAAPTSPASFSRGHGASASKPSTREKAGRSGRSR